MLSRAIASNGKLTTSPKAATVRTKSGSTQSRGMRLPQVFPEKVGTVETIIRAIAST